MNTQLKWKLVAAGAAVVAAVAGGVAIASTHHPAAASAATAASFRPGGGPPDGGFRGRGGDPLSAASTYLGVSTSDLFTQLRSGKTLAQIAAATSGKSASGLIDALVTAQRKELEQAVTDGRMTRDQADRIESDLKAHVTERVEGTFDDRGGPPDGGFDPGGDDAGQTRTGSV
jgi:hypothetical protein